MLIYNAHLKNPINQDFDFNQFINYTILKKDFSFFKKGLDYFRDIQTFLQAIEKNKNEMFENFGSSGRIINSQSDHSAQTQAHR